MNCIVETPKGYGVKYNYDPKLGCMELAKMLPAGLVFPFDLGYIPGTKGEDGDPLDVIILSEVPAFPGCTPKTTIAPFTGAIMFWRRERDSNPRTCNSQRFSRPPQSTTLPSLRGQNYSNGTIFKRLFLPQATYFLS